MTRLPRIKQENVERAFFYLLNEGMVLRDREDGQERMITCIDSPEYNNNRDACIQLEGYDGFCICESWYTLDELLVRYELTDKTANHNDKANVWLQCDCDNEVN